MFSDVREYVPGDDIRSISWNVTARMSKPYIKTFEESREAQIILAVDASASMDFGFGGIPKKEAVELLSAALALCGQKNKDPMGLLLFSEEEESFLPPKKGAKQGWKIIGEICKFKARRKKTDMEKSLSFLNRILKKRSHIFIFSDFLSEKPFSKALSKLSKKHEVICLVVSDLLEREIPPLGLLSLQDLETGQMKSFDFSSPFFRREFEEKIQVQTERRKRELLRSGVQIIDIHCEKDIFLPLTQYFQKRRKRLA